MWMYVRRAPSTSDALRERDHCHQCCSGDDLCWAWLSQPQLLQVRKYTSRGSFGHPKLITGTPLWGSGPEGETGQAAHRH